MSNTMKTSEFYKNVQMTKEEYLNLPPMEEYIEILGNYTNKKITKEQALEKVSDVYRALSKELIEKTWALGNEWRPLFPIKRLFGKNLSLDPELVELI